MSSDYHFVTRWRVEATPAEVYEIIDQPCELVRWWPSVYLDVQELPPPAGDTRKVYKRYTKGWLPYTLRWSFRTTQKEPPHRLVLEAWGDFVGWGEWTFTADGRFVDVVYDDPDNLYHREERIQMSGPSRLPVHMRLPLRNPDRRSFSYRITLVGADNSITRGDFSVPVTETLISVR